MNEEDSPTITTEVTTSIVLSQSNLFKRNSNENNIVNNTNCNNSDQKVKHQSQVLYSNNQKLSDDMSSLVNNELLADVIFKVGGQVDACAKEIFAHRIILCQRSQYFKTLFVTSGMRESIQPSNGKLLVIEKPNISFAVFCKVLQYLYSGTVELTNEDAMFILAAADEMQINELKQFCVTHIQERIETSNSLMVLEKAYQYCAQHLVNQCYEFIKHNTSEVLLTNAFLEASKDTLIRFLDSEFLAIDEIAIFSSVIRWGLYQLMTSRTTTQLTLEEDAVETTTDELDELSGNSDAELDELFTQTTAVIASASSHHTSAILLSTDEPTNRSSSITTPSAVSQDSDSPKPMDKQKKKSSIINLFSKKKTSVRTPSTLTSAAVTSSSIDTSSSTTTTSSSIPISTPTTPQQTLSSSPPIVSITQCSTVPNNRRSHSNYISIEDAIKYTDSEANLRNVALQLAKLDKIKLKEIVRDLMPFIRFPLMNANQLTDIVEPFNLVDDWLLLEAYRYIAAPDRVPSTNKRAQKRRGLSETLSQEFEGSTILATQQKLILNSWTDFTKSNTKKKWMLLFKASRDGWDAKCFHDKCDNKGATIVVLRSQDGYIFGGFNSKSWSSNQQWVQAYDTFIFTLLNPFNDGPRKLKVKNPQRAVYNHGSFGPTFGGGGNSYFEPFDLYLDSSLQKGHTNVGCSYSSFRGGWRTQQAQQSLAGSLNSWTLNEIEVYYLS